MALNDNPLDALVALDLDITNPISLWSREDDGLTARNNRLEQLRGRDNELLDQIKFLAKFGTTNVSPIYPFKSDALLKPSEVEIIDTDGNPITNFEIDLAALELPKRFIKDLKLIQSVEFSDPFLSKLELIRTVDPVTNLLRIFIDLEFSARFSVDGQDRVIFELKQKAFNDNPTAEDASSQDNRPFQLTALTVDNTMFLNSGIIEFAFLGSVYSTTSTSWSFGTLDGTIQGDGFSLPINLERITYRFDRAGTKITQLAYNQLADLADAVPFLRKVKFFPFEPESSAGAILSGDIIDLNITAPADQRIYIKRIRKKDVGGETFFVFMFAHNVFDESGNFLRTVNIGVAEIGPNSGTKVFITSLGSNTIAGVEPDFLDEVPGDTFDSFGHGFLRVLSYESLDTLFQSLLESTVEVGSPSPIVVSPESGDSTVVGVFADADQILMTDTTSTIDGIALDTIGVLITVFENKLFGHETRNIHITIDGEVINQRIVMGDEAKMRDFYGIEVAESLVDNEKIVIGDEWFDEPSGRLRKYLVFGGKRQWRAT